MKSQPITGILCLLQEDKDGATTRVLHRYTADKLSSFGELALMYVMMGYSRLFTDALKCYYEHYQVYSDSMKSK